MEKTSKENDVSDISSNNAKDVSDLMGSKLTAQCKTRTRYSTN